MNSFDRSNHIWRINFLITVEGMDEEKTLILSMTKGDHTIKNAQS